LLTPSFNLASVSAIKTNTDGSALIQVGGNVEHGDSGGPALDANGRIVGVVSFGGPDNQGITAFLRSSDSARRLLAKAKVNTRPGAFQVAWERAFSDYAAAYLGHWRRSSAELGALLKVYPQFKGARPYANWAQAEARVEPLPQQRPTLTPTIAAILGALAALALALIAVTLFRAARATPRKRHTLPITYPPAARTEQAGATALLDVLDDRLTPAAQRLN
ncbi:MAG: trypsin-like serine protease, partial [Ktedonobacterales bacterium]